MTPSCACCRVAVCWDVISVLVHGPASVLPEQRSPGRILPRATLPGAGAFGALEPVGQTHHGALDAARHGVGGAGVAPAERVEELAPGEEHLLVADTRAPESVDAPAQ